MADVAVRAGLDAEERDGLVQAVSEVVANAHRHGRPPVRVRITAASDGVHVEVRDAGTGPGRHAGQGRCEEPSSPGAGDVPPHLPPATSESGRGLWLAQRLCGGLTTAVDDEGFVVRLLAGAGHRSPQQGPWDRAGGAGAPR